MFKKVKAALGGRIKVVISGGAPLSRSAEEFCKVALGCPVGQGYGLTETCAASFLQVRTLLNGTVRTVLV